MKMYANIYVTFSLISRSGIMCSIATDAFTVSFLYEIQSNTTNSSSKINLVMEYRIYCWSLLMKKTSCTVHVS